MSVEIKKGQGSGEWFTFVGDEIIKKYMKYLFRKYERWTQIKDIDFLIELLNKFNEFQLKNEFNLYV